MIQILCVYILVRKILCDTDIVLYRYCAFILVGKMLCVYMLVGKMLCVYMLVEKMLRGTDAAYRCYGIQRMCDHYQSGFNPYGWRSGLHGLGITITHKGPEGL